MEKQHHQHPYLSAQPTTMKCHEPSTIITPVLVSEFSSCFCFTFGSFLTFGSFFNLWLLWLLWLLLHPHGLRGCGDRLRCRALHALHGPEGPCASQRGAQRGDGRIGNLANYYFGNVTSCCYRYIYIYRHTYLPWLSNSKSWRGHSIDDAVCDLIRCDTMAATTP